MFSVPTFRKKVLVAEFAFLSSVTLTPNLQVYTFPAVNFGAAASDRRIHIISSAGAGPSGNDLGSVTVGGVLADITVKLLNGDTSTAITTALVPSGLSGDVVVSYLTAGKGRCTIGVYRSTGLSSNIPIATGTSNANPGTGNLASAPNGFALGGAGANSSGTVVWSGLAENYDANPEGQATASGASAATTGAPVVPSATYTSADSNAAAFATFGP